MNSYNLSIITPNEKIFDEPIEALRAPGVKGSFGILAKHTPMIVALKNGVLSITQNNVDRFFMIKAGVLEVSQDNNVLILTDEVILSRNREDAKEKVKNLIEV